MAFSLSPQYPTLRWRADDGGGRSGVASVAMVGGVSVDGRASVSRLVVTGSAVVGV